MREEIWTGLRDRGWRIARGGEAPPAAPPTLLARYGPVLTQWLTLLEGVESAVNQEETAWLLCAGDYAAQGDGAFRWDEWERLSLESAAGDPAWEAEIRRFWDRRLPIALSVGDGYAYYALSAEDGAVVYGREPEFEECAAVAASPAEFLEKLRTGAIRL